MKSFELNFGERGAGVASTLQDNTMSKDSLNHKINNLKQLPHDGRRCDVQSFRLNLRFLFHSALPSTLRDFTLGDVTRCGLCQRRCSDFESEFSHTGKERLAMKIQTGQDGRLLESDKEKDYQQFS